MSSTIMWTMSCLISYVAGSVPTGYLVARAKGVDIRSVGSGNTGATNVFRNLGKACGIFTLAADMLKGFLPALLFPIIADRLGAGIEGRVLAVACAGCAVAGHNWSIFLKFKGGKGVATSAGALLAIAPAAVGAGFAVWFIVFLISKYVSLASMLAATVIAGCAWCFYREEGLLVPIVFTLLALVLIWRHRTNIVRMLDGTEAKIGGKKNGKDGGDESE